MPSKIKISIAAKSDAKLISSLAKEIWTQHYSPIIGKNQVDYMLEKYQSESAIARDIQNEYTYYIAKAGDTPCGYCSIKKDDGIFVSKFYVKQSHRGNGIGKLMLAEIQNFAINNNENRIWLTCNKYNETSLKVYKRLGFKVIDSIVTNIGSGYVMDDYVLEKHI